MRRRVDARFELAGFLSRVDGHRAVLFLDVADGELPVVGNTVCRRGHIADALGCTPAEAAETFDRAASEPRPCHEIDPASAPVLEQRMEDERGLEALPIPIHHERDAGRYLSAGVVIARDPRSQRLNLSINRLQVMGPRELRALILPGRLRTILSETEDAGQSLELAICLGVDPTVLLASQARPIREVDELEVVSALRAKPLGVTRAPSLDLSVPAAAEIVIEARVRVGERATEGPFGEFPRTYGPPAPAPVLDVVAIWHRRDALFQTILSAGREHLLVGGVPREADLLRRLREVNPAVERVRLTEGGSCRFHAVLSIRDPQPGHAVNAILAALATNPMLKRVVAVDADIDVFSDEEVEWALATRVQADRDLVVIPRARGSSLDPSARARGTTAKLGIDATIPPDGGDYARMHVPGADALDLAGDVEEP